MNDIITISAYTESEFTQKVMSYVDSLDPSRIFQIFIILSVIEDGLEALSTWKESHQVGKDNPIDDETFSISYGDDEKTTEVRQVSSFLFKDELSVVNKLVIRFEWMNDTYTLTMTPKNR